MSISRWSLGRVALLAGSWLVLVPLALWTGFQLLLWHGARRLAADQPYYVHIEVSGWWVETLWLLPPLLLLLWWWRARAR